MTEVKFARWKKKSLGIAHAFFPSKADASTAMKRNKDLLGGRYIELFFQVSNITERMEFYPKSAIIFNLKKSVLIPPSLPPVTPPLSLLPCHSSPVTPPLSLSLFLQTLLSEQHRKPTSAPADDVDCERDPAPWELKAAALQTDGDDALIETGRIFVRNLSYLCKTEDLEALFFPFGPVVETHLSLDPNTKRPKGISCI